MFRGYGDDYMQLDHERLSCPFTLHQGEINKLTDLEKLADLSPEHIRPLLDPRPEVLLIGSGRYTAFPEPAVMQLLDTTRVGFECMDSRSAARTYNILVGEGRNVSLLMLLPAAR
ncbi:MAG: MTH938/NDUFAF3 family protein [Mariprofundaceae bacterium]|nr:MTH938/NDUFAF3 family protein [Mariprofundaceae bacterium]